MTGVEISTAAGVSFIPSATYRLQFSGAFTFRDAERIVPTLHRLGITHLYASPILKARPGSTHGYDIVDHSALNPELGSAEDFDALVTTLHDHGLGLILDIVPNHMGIGGDDNPWWLDVLEWGQGSPFEAFFDIDWAPPEPSLRGKVLLPFLGDHYGRVLEKGELRLAFDPEAGSFSVWYYHHRFPIAIKDYPALLRDARTLCGSDGAALAALASEFTRVPTTRRAARQQAVVRQTVTELRGRLVEAVDGGADVREAIAALVLQLNGTAGDLATLRRLHELLERQHYRLAYWRVATAEINYRRFFDINDLAGLRIQDPEAFELTHQRLFRLIGEGKVQGVRVDHIDGLHDPAAYCRKLQDRAAYLLMQAQAGAPAGHHVMAGAARRRDHLLYLVVEKILATHERLREDWAVDGTTGYDFLNLVNGVFVAPEAEAALTEIYDSFLGRARTVEETLVEAKRQVLETNLVSELYVLVGHLRTVARQAWKTRDFTLYGLRRALVDIISHFPVYRTYLTERGVADADARDLATAAAEACRERVGTDTSPIEFVASILSTELARDRASGYKRADILRTALKFQQFTGSVMAKAVEDTAFYRYHRLISLNEVGGDPARFGVSLTEFHRTNAERQRRFPFGMVATATHDHKRGEDARARINVLTEVPEEWSRRVTRWARLNRGRKTLVDGQRAPRPNAEYLLYQALLGAWPLDDETRAASGGHFADRMAQYLVKALREAKTATSWAEQNRPYEESAVGFVRALLAPGKDNTFLADFVPFQRRIALAGALNGLSQCLLKLTVPGVPDIYQGTEFWDFSLVDPDNRRPVDFAARAAGLAGEMTFDDDAAVARLVEDWRTGHIKQFIIQRCLTIRRLVPQLFTVGDYLPLEVAGANADRLIAFMRRSGDFTAVVVAPRLVARLIEGTDRPLVPAEAWGDTAVVKPGGTGRETCRDIFTGCRHTMPEHWAAGQLLSKFPVAMLISPAIE